MSRILVRSADGSSDIIVEYQEFPSSESGPERALPGRSRFATATGQPVIAEGPDAYRIAGTGIRLFPAQQ
jgi:hypothetical protein